MAVFLKCEVYISFSISLSWFLYISQGYAVRSVGRTDIPGTMEKELSLLLDLWLRMVLK
jgi:hypothetical protein